jgi:hypothetical protein
MANDVMSTFSKGRFTQELHTTLWSPPGDSSVATAETNRETQSLLGRYAKPKAPDDNKVVGLSTDNAGGDSTGSAGNGTSSYYQVASSINTASPSDSPSDNTDTLQAQNTNTSTNLNTSTVGQNTYAGSSDPNDDRYG